MVNFVEAQKPLLHGLVKMAGLRPLLIEVEPGNMMHFWVPKHHLASNKKIAPNSSDTPHEVNESEEEEKKKKKKKKSKPALLLIHGFAAEGIVTWQFQFGVLVTKYDVYIPDLFFFGQSTTENADRSPDFQAMSVAKGLGKLGVSRCDVVGFSYGGMVAFKMAEARPDLVRSLVVSGSVITMTDSINEASLAGLGVSSSSELLLPETVDRLKALLSISMHKKMWFPNRLYKDYLEIMFVHRKERRELLEGLVISNTDAKIPVFQQRILLLWGEKDSIFNLELAKKMKEQLGEKATLESIPNAGHLLHVERPCAYNRVLKKFLASVNAEDAN
ncbi:uncharacterized protein [Typha angustifolia]|uniref:uncharacterized protein n=1 Tax=Typha angustifolia TaxID=59011 RepID=UPI003C2FF0EF